jgi:Eco57I restriction-modification methylase
MDTGKLKKFAQTARLQLIEQVGSRLDQVLHSDSVELREKSAAVKELKGQIEATSKAAVIDRVAYTWFNRFCALRFMDLNRYTGLGVLSPAEGQSQPEILAEAKLGHIDQDMVPVNTRRQVLSLLDGSVPSRDPQAEAYRLLLVAACNAYHSQMPFMFEKISDFTELLLPVDLLSDNSILGQMRHALNEESCKDVEVIGWLYQFYISEKKDDVFAALKKGDKITPENIPAATQLFTPHWIVRYLVENSLGRLWMLNHSDSRLAEQMDYYIRPEDPGTDFLRISSPEEIKICDPACGSGHMLTYAFDLLYVIYEEQGYQKTDIPRLILTHNLYGIEIDQRAGALAAFALTMKAREKYRRFLQGGKVVQPNICVLENIQIDSADLSAYMDKVGRDLFSSGLQGVVNQWEEAENFGSLIRPIVSDVSEVLELLRERQVGEDLFLDKTHRKVLKALRQADYLSSKYHVVVANPPYMGSRGMNQTLKDFLTSNHDDFKSDLFASCIVRFLQLCVDGGELGFMSPFTWMFISTYEPLRRLFFDSATITSLVQLEYSGFEGATVPICTFTLQNRKKLEYRGAYIRLSDFRGASIQGEKTLQAIRDHDCGWFYRACTEDFEALPGAPIAFWISGTTKNIYETCDHLLGELVKSEGKNVTTNNERFIKCFWEVSLEKVGARHDWFPVATGGGYRKWAGNIVDVIDWSNVAQSHYRAASAGRIIREEFWDKPGVTWGKISSSRPSFRFLHAGEMYQETAVLRENDDDALSLLAILNSKVATFLLSFLSPTLNFQLEDIKAIPITSWPSIQKEIGAIAKELVITALSDWNSFETSIDFSTHPLTRVVNQTLGRAYKSTRSSQKEFISNTRDLETKLNEKLVVLYGLDGELEVRVPIDEVTLSCNPCYRYDNDKSGPELEALLLADTMREFISYAVGCMFGRYSLDKPGLILANQGDTADDYRQQIPNPTFAPDEDNVIPLLDGDWFTDDISGRFKEFLKVTFSAEHYEENLTFLENALYPDNLTGKKRKTIRDYFLKEFYSHHVKLYKKRPIYWLFSSPKGSFNALIYMHRYRPDTVSVILNDYLREFRTKLESRLEHLKRIEASADASKSEKTKSLKEVERLRKIIDELETWERDVLYPLATQQIEIDLDDGVKANYPKFGTALKKITGLSK